MSAWKELRRALAVLVTACGVAAAAGQTVTYLAPAKYQAALGEKIAVHVEAGDQTTVKRAAWPTERIDWLFVRAAGTQTNRENVGPAGPNSDFVDVSLDKPGVTLIGLDTKPVVENTAGRQFKAFMKRVALSRSHADRVAALADEDHIRTRRIESAKTLVRVTQPKERPASQSAIAQSKTGQEVEIRPLADPTMVPVGSDLPVRAYVLGDKKAGVKMLATCVASGKTLETLTDPSGSCHFRIDQGGAWRIEFHHAEPLESGGDWVIYSATLTFETSYTGAGK